MPVPTWTTHFAAPTLLVGGTGTVGTAVGVGALESSEESAAVHAFWESVVGKFFHHRIFIRVVATSAYCAARVQ